MKILDLLNPSKKQVTLEEITKEKIDKLTLKFSGYMNFDDRKSIETLVKTISIWFEIQFETEMKKYGVEKKRILDFMNLDIYRLLDIYNENELANTLNKDINKKLFQKYEDDPKFKETIHKCVLYNLLSKKKNIEYGLVFCKTFDLNLSLAMKYLPSDSLQDEELIQKYVDNRGSIDIDFYPNYFNLNSKDKFYQENLEDKLNEIKKFKMKVIN